MWVVEFKWQRRRKKTFEHGYYERERERERERENKKNVS